MATTSTSHYHLERLQANDSFADNGYQYTDADRVLIDRLLFVGAESHHHSGAAPVVVNLTSPPTLALHTNAGTLSSGTRFFYKISMVDPSGLETAASPEAEIDTPDPILTPDPPTLSLETGGTLPAGFYYYAISAYYPTPSEETDAPNSAFAEIPFNTSSIRVTFPTLPSGAAGWNIYRRSPNESDFFFLTSVVAGPASWLDAGALSEKCDQRRSDVNTTISTNSVTVTLPVALPGAGWSWKIYRAFGSSGYESSLVHQVTEESAPGVVQTSYVDLGEGTLAESPLSYSQLIGAPSKVNLADAAEVQGRLPVGAVQGFPMVVTFVFLGSLTVTAGTNTWVCEYPRAQVIGARASLGRGSHPAAQSVIVDVNKGTGTNPTPSSIFTTQSTRPTISVGAQIGTRSTPQTTSLVAGDSLTVDIDQVGGGATPTDQDLTVNVTLLVQHDNLVSNNAWS